MWTKVQACAAHSGCSLVDFATHILGEGRLAKSVYVTSLLYLQRFAGALTARGFPQVCPQCLYTGSLLLAAKYTHDEPCALACWAVWSGLSAAYLRQLELFLLQAAGFELAVDQAQFERWAALFSRQCDRTSDPLAGAGQLVSVLSRRLLAVDVDTSDDEQDLAPASPPTPQPATRLYRPTLAVRPARYSPYSTPVALKTVALQL